jgi:hypothetical protein
MFAAILHLRVRVVKPVTMEADISNLRKPGHFYFALTAGDDDGHCTSVLKA